MNNLASGMSIDLLIKSLSSLLADARRILGLAREPAAEAVVGFQITDLASQWQPKPTRSSRSTANA